MISPLQLAAVILRIALTTFGSSQSAAIQREIVRVRGWLTMDEFLDLRGVALVSPGPNSPSLAMLVGLQLAGTRGAILAYLAASIPGLAITLLLGVLALDPHVPVVRAALRGAAAASVGLLFASAVELTAIYRGKLIALALAVATLEAVAIAHLSLWLTLIIFLPLSLALRRR